MKTVRFMTKGGWWMLPAVSIITVAAGCVSTGPAGARDTGAAAVSTAAPGPYDGYYFEAQLLMSRGDLEPAIEILMPLADKSDCPPEVLTALAFAQLRNRDSAAALNTLADARKRFPGFVPGYQLSARIHRLKNENDAAIADLDAALKVEPRNPDMLEEAGMLLLQGMRKSAPGGTIPKDDPNLARLLDIYTRLAEVHEGSDRIVPLLVLTSIHTQMGENEKAIESAKAIVDIKPQDIRGHRALAEACENAGKENEALAAYRQAMLIEPENDEVRAKVMDLVRRTNFPGGMLGLYKDLATSFPRVREIQSVYGEELQKARMWKEAADLYEGALKLWPEDRPFKIGLIRSLFGAGRDRDAMKLAEGLVGDPGISNAEVMDLAAGLREAGKLDSVIALLKRLADANPDDHRITLQLASVQLEAGRTSDAIKTLENLVKRKPTLFVANAMLGGIYADGGKFDKAHELYDKAISQADKAGANDLKQLKAEVYRREGRTSEALALLDELLGSGGDASESALQAYVRICEATRNFSRAHEAIDRFTAAVSGEAKISALRLKAFLYWRSDDHEGAVRVLDGLHSENPKDFQIASFLIEVLIDARQFDRAAALIDSTGTETSEEFKNELQLLRARVYKGQGKSDEALALLEALMTSNPNEERYYMVAGEYYHTSGRLDEAERVLRKAMEINPANPEAFNALGYFFAEAGIKLDEAAELVNKAIKLNPNAGHIWDSLGWIYFKQGKFEKAVEALEQAVLKMKDDPDAVVLDHMGDAYQKTGQMEKARKAWNDALRLNPDNPGAIRDKLAHP